LSQVETDPVPHLVVDVRSAEAAADAPLPPELSGAVQIPEEEVPSCSLSVGWSQRTVTVAASCRRVQARCLVQRLSLARETLEACRA